MVGLIARADQGGLAAVTWEFARHMNPEKVLLLCPDGRSTKGISRPERFSNWDTRIVKDVQFSDQDIDWLLTCDTIYTAETAYSNSLWDKARAKGVRTILHVMPEITDEQPTEMWLPTRWREDLFPDAQLVPIPVATDRIPCRLVTEVRTWLHPLSNAPHDRNGTEVLLEALQYLQTPCKLVFQGMHEQPLTWPHAPKVEVEYMGETENYWEPYCREDIFGLVLPRRYGGLSLPMNQAFAAGWPVVSLNLLPQNEWLSPHSLVSAQPMELKAMKGGSVNVHDARPEELAKVMDYTMESRQATLAFQQSLFLANRFSWNTLQPMYEKLLK